MTHSVLVSVGLVLTLIHLCHGLSSCESASVEDADSIIVESSKYVKIHTDDEEECLVMMNMLMALVVVKKNDGAVNDDGDSDGDGAVMVIELVMNP